VVGLLAAAPLVAGCQTSAITGRTQLNAFSLTEEVDLGREAFDQVVAEGNLVTSGPELAMVERIMQRITAVAGGEGYEWEVVLIQDDQTVNAFALPGGKMAVYTGILPVAQTEAGLAVVMGHEIGHVVEHHGAARVTRAMGAELVTQLLVQDDYADLATQARALLFDLPFSRGDESDADHVGLILMARAGYDPREAPVFWERMSALSQGAPPEFLSTHPSNETRVQDLKRLMPKALAEYQGP